MSTVLFDTDGEVAVVTINRPEVRNAVGDPTAAALVEAFHRFDADEALPVAVLTGAGGTFCAGADLKAVAAGQRRRISEDGEAPMGPSRMLLSKPVLAAVEGYAVAGGLELALWCDLRVAATDAVFGVFCRRWGVPLIDLGTVRLPRLIGHSQAMDLILTGRGVSGEEALRMGLANRLVERGRARDAAVELAQPDEYNTITPALREELAAAIDEADADPAVRVILLRAEGPAFCAGYGLDWSTAAQAEEGTRGRVWDSVADLRMISRFVDTYMKLWYAAKPT